MDPNILTALRDAGLDHVAVLFEAQSVATENVSVEKLINAGVSEADARRAMTLISGDAAAVEPGESATPPVPEPAAVATGPSTPQGPSSASQAAKTLGMVALGGVGVAAVCCGGWPGAAIALAAGGALAARSSGRLGKGVGIVVALAGTLGLGKVGVEWWTRDTDVDGTPDRVDCDPTATSIATRTSEDDDCDGVVNDADCAPADANDSKSKQTDADCDALADLVDCDPHGHVGDDDCDETPNAEDCDATNAELKTRKSEDTDCDGTVNTEDCAVSDKEIATKKAEDQDCDGAIDTDDCAVVSPLVASKRSEVGDCRGPLLVEGMIASKAPSVPTTFDGSNPLSGLVAPNATADSTQLSPTERAAMAVVATNTLWIADSECKLEVNDVLGKVFVDCGPYFEDKYFVVGQPYTKRSVQCDYSPPTSCGSCSSNSDCELGIFVGCLGGCAQSRCLWGQCTACPGSTMCDPPAFNESGVMNWTFGFPATGSAAELFKAGGGTMVVAFRTPSATRQVFTKKAESAYGEASTGKLEVEHDTGYRVRAVPQYVAYHKGSRWVIVQGPPTIGGTVTRDGATHAIQCTAELCTVN